MKAHQASPSPNNVCAPLLSRSRPLRGPVSSISQSRTKCGATSLRKLGGRSDGAGTGVNRCDGGSPPARQGVLYLCISQHPHLPLVVTKRDLAVLNTAVSSLSLTHKRELEVSRYTGLRGGPPAAHRFAVGRIRYQVARFVKELHIYVAEKVVVMPIFVSLQAAGCRRCVCKP